MTSPARKRLVFLMLAALTVASLAGIARWRAHRGPALALPTLPATTNASPALRDALADAARQATSHAEDPAAIRRVARLYHANGFLREARAVYGLIPADRRTARDCYYLADLARGEGGLDEALSHLGATLELDAGYLPARFALAETLLKLGRDQEAERHYRSVLAADAAEPHAAFGLARIELQQGKEDAALAQLEELVASHPESTDGAALLAQLLERRGESDRAVALKQMSGQRPAPPLADPWLAELLGDTYDIQRLGLKFEELFRAGQGAEATAVMQRIERLDPQSPLPHMLRGWSEVQAQRYRDAVPHYRAALAKRGDVEKIAPYLVQSWLALGEADEAQKWTAEVHARLPESIPILTAYVDVALRQQNRGLARVLLTKLLEKEPYLQSQNMALARILWEAGEREAAVVCLQRVAEVAARDIASRALLGEYFLDKGDPESAIGPLEQALENAMPTTPAHQQLRALLGSAYLRAGEQLATKGQWLEARRHADRLTRLEPADLRGHALKADCALQMGEFPVAIEALRAMVALQPANPTIHLSLGDVLYQAGDMVEARRHWENARQRVAPADRELREALAARLTGRITTETFR